MPNLADPVSLGDHAKHDENLDDVEMEDEEDEPLPIVFRNYKPVDEMLKKYQMKAQPIPNIAAEIELKLSQVIESNKVRDVLNLAPKKANWDLKRDLGKKMEMLDRRTQQAITKMVLEKFRQEPSTSLEEKVNTMYHTAV